VGPTNHVLDAGGQDRNESIRRRDGCQVGDAAFCQIILTLVLFRIISCVLPVFCAGRKSSADWWIDDGAGRREVSTARPHCAQNTVSFRHKTGTVSRKLLVQQFV